MRPFKSLSIIHCTALFFMLVVAPAISSGQNNKVKLGPIPAWVNKISADTSIMSPVKDISDGYFIMLSDKQYNDSTHSSYYHYVQKIISESGIQNGSDISVSFAPSYQNLVFHTLKVIRNGKEINQLNLQGFKVVQAETEREKNMYDGELSAEYLLTDIRKGDIIEYSYSLNGKNPVFNNKTYYDLDVEFGVPVGRLYYSLILPKDATMQVKYFKTDVRFNKLTKGNEYVLDLQNVNAIKADDHLPSWYCAYGYVQFTQFSSWAEYVNWELNIFKTSSSISPELGAKLKELRKSNPADKDFVLACIRFVQDEIRYEGIEIGQNNQKPYPPSQVFSQRFGDCKDKSLLLCTMLRAEGFTADPEVVNTNSRQVVGEWLPSPSDFNHCIVKMKLGNVPYWIDPTISMQRGELNSLSFPEYKLGLVINSSSLALDTIPEKITARVESNEKYILKDTASASELAVVTKYYGIDADNIRYYFANNSRTDIEKLYTNFYARSYPKISMTDSILYADDEASNIITITEKYSVEDLWERKDDGWKAPFEAENIESKITVPHSRLRKTPVGINYPTDFTQTIDIIPPRLWKISDDSFTINMDGLEYNYTKSYTNDVIHLYFHLRISKDFIPVEQLDTYFTNTKKINDFIGYHLLWHPNISDTGTDTSTSSTNWIMVIVFILFLLFIAMAFHRLYTIDFNASAWRQTTKPIGGWLVLVAIGLFFSPIRVLFWIFSSHYFNLEQWNLLTKPGTISYNPSLSVLLVLELIGNAFLASSAIYLLILFFKKRTSFPKTIIFFYAFDLAFILADYIGASLVVHRDSLDSDAWNHIIRSVIPAAIWIPYFMVSERVKETFTQTYKVKTIESIETTLPVITETAEPEEPSEPEESNESRDSPL